MKPDSKIYFDLIRGIAALLVLIGHVRAFLFLPYKELDDPSLLLDIFYFATGLGHQGVMIFFVLSGFLISNSIKNALEANAWNWGQYAINRITRLWVVLFPCLLLTLFWDQLTLYLTATEFYSGSRFSELNIGPDPGQYDAGSQTFVLNMFFMQTINGPSYGSNTPLWSLANEFWYYVLFPAGYMLVSTQVSFATRVVCALIIVGSLWFLPLTILSLGIVWLFGYIAVEVAHSKMKPEFVHSPAFTFIALLCLASVLTLAKLNWVSFVVADLLVGAAVAGLLLSLSTKFTIAKWFDPKIKLLADMSYTIYLAHFPFIVFLITVGYGDARPEQGLSAWMCFFSVILSTLLYSYFIYWLFERKTDALKYRLRTLARS